MPTPQVEELQRMWKTKIQPIKFQDPFRSELIKLVDTLVKNNQEDQIILDNLAKEVKIWSS